MKSLDVFVGDSVDKLVTLEIRRHNQVLLRKLYESARNQIGRPLTLMAAEKLKNEVNEEDTVIITTGILYIPGIPRGALDGPTSAASLARAINVSIGAKVVLLTERPLVQALEAVCWAAGFRTYTYEDTKKIPRSLTVQDYPVSKKEAKEAADRLIDDLKPTAVIAIEKIGPNQRGVYHSALGLDISRWQAKIDYLFNEARNRGILTIGVGDLGNEIGLGSLMEVVREFAIPYGSKCACPCGGGIATVTECDVPVIGTHCNWGAYGIEACLAYLSNNLKVLHSPVIERLMIEECISQGMWWTGEPEPLDTFPCLMRLLRTLIEVNI